MFKGVCDKDTGVGEHSFDLEPVVMMEGLEPRVLLSAAHYATPFFQLYRPPGAISPAQSAGPIGLTPAEISNAYGFNMTWGDGTGQTIAIVDAYDQPNIIADLAAFDTQFGLPDPTLTVVNQNGGGILPIPDPMGGWGVETSLDVEAAHAMAPGANILLVEASSASFSDMFTAVSTAASWAGVSVVSMSWGADEFAGQTAYDSYFTTPGVTFVAASGDYGAYSPFTSTKAVSYPAASPTVLSVGGTTLTLDVNGNYLSETGWGNDVNSGFFGGSGGGISQYESKPVYQKSVVKQSATKRTVPDVAMDADPASGVAILDSWDFGAATPWEQVGGTSLSAPIWAGIIAIADQQRAVKGLAPLNALGQRQTLAAIYSLPATTFNDIITGNNGFAAGIGYDLVTGRGTPIVNRLVPALSQAAPIIGSFSVSPLSAVTGTTITLTAANVTEPGGTITSVDFYMESNGIGGLQTATDTFVGTGVKTGTTWKITSSTTGFFPATYTYYAVATDSDGVTAADSARHVVIGPKMIQRMMLSRPSVAQGTPDTVTALGVQETGRVIVSVDFYLVSNGGAGPLWYFVAGGLNQVGPTTWSATFTTTVLPVGNYKGFAIATDNLGIPSQPSVIFLWIGAATPVPPGASAPVPPPISLHHSHPISLHHSLLIFHPPS